MKWLSMLKQMSITTKTKSQPAKSKQKTKQESPQNSPIPTCFRPSRLSDGDGRSRSSYNVGSASTHAFLNQTQEKTRQNLTESVVPEDDFWRFSFGKQSNESNDSGARLEDDIELQFLSSGGSYRSNGVSISEFSESGKFSDMLADVRKAKLENNLKKERSKIVNNRRKTRFKKPQWKAMKDQRVAEHELKTADRSIPEEDMILCSGSFHEDHIGTKPERMILEPLSGETVSLDSRKSDRSTDKEHHQRITEESTILLNSKQKLVKKDQTIEDIQLKNNKQRGVAPNSPRGNRDLHRRKIRHRSKIGVQSPRTALRMEICKIRAVEDLKKAKKKKEKKRGKAFESFAVVKCSFNPQEDFRESMMEMISEKGIRRPEELESLLACYLSLNSDEYHDIIIKVFRQVWFDLNQDCSASEFEDFYY